MTSALNAHQCNPHLQANGMLHYNGAIKQKTHCIADTSTALSLMVSSTLQALLSSLIGIHKRDSFILQHVVLHHGQLWNLSHPGPLQELPDAV